MFQPARPLEMKSRVENRRARLYGLVVGGGGGGDQPDAFGGRGDRAENGDRFEAAGGAVGGLAALGPGRRRRIRRRKVLPRLPFRFPGSSRRRRHGAVGCAGAATRPRGGRRVDEGVQMELSGGHGCVPSVLGWMRQVSKGRRTQRVPCSFVASASGIKVRGCVFVAWASGSRCVLCLLGAVRFFDP